MIDTTSSMIKYENFINYIPSLNKELKKNFTDIKIGYILYKDYLKDNNKFIKLNENIETYKPSSEDIIILENINFSGGYDYAEDWGNPINKISQICNENEENIVFHITDSNTHGSMFSDYDITNTKEEKKEEQFLIKALKNCSSKQIKFIGFLLSDFARKSFLECKKIYNEEFNGFYEIFDLTKNELDYNFLSNIIIKMVKNILNNEYIIYKYLINFYNKDETDFIFEDLLVEMKPLYEIEQYKGKNFQFLPKLKIKSFEDYVKIKQGITQGYLGDCYLISSILSMLNMPLIFNYIFPNSLNF